MFRIRTLVAAACAAGALGALAPAAQATTWCAPPTAAYQGCWHVNGTCVTSAGAIAGKPYRLNCVQ